MDQLWSETENIWGTNNNEIHRQQSNTQHAFISRNLLNRLLNRDVELSSQPRTQTQKHLIHSQFIVFERPRCDRPMSSGSGMESGNCAATSCFKVATLYPPGETSPGIISGKWKVDLGWSTSFKDSCHSEEVISTCYTDKNTTLTCGHVHRVQARFDL